MLNHGSIGIGWGVSSSLLVGWGGLEAQRMRLGYLFDTDVAIFGERGQQNMEFSPVKDSKHRHL